MTVLYRQTASDGIVRQFRYYLLSAEAPEIALRLRQPVRGTIHPCAKVLIRVEISQPALDTERRPGMSYSISTLLTRNLHHVVGENDLARRRAGRTTSSQTAYSSLFCTSYAHRAEKIGHCACSVVTASSSPER